MNWDDLRIFLAVARGQSLSAAGRALRIDPATVSRRISRLEHELGAPLFAKSSGGHELTDTGLRLIPSAEQAEAAFGSVRDVLGRRGSGQGARLSGAVRIGAPDGCANFLLPPVVAQISQAHPDLDIQIVALPRVVNLTRREADMAITVSAPSAARLMVEKICDYRLHLAAHPVYLQRFGRPKARSDLEQHRVVGYIPDMIFDKELDYLAEMDVERAALTSNSVSVQFHMIRQGAGIGVVHDFALPSAPELRRVLTGDVHLTRSFYLVRHKSDQELRRMRLLADLLMAGLRRETGRLEGLAEAQ